ncbi:unnamed protein product [Rhodiola kirilowii]
MCTPNMLMKQEFIKRWTIALKTLSCCKAPSKELCAIEKKNIIKQTAAIAMAATKGGSTAWSRSIIADECDNNKILIEAVMGSQDLAKQLKKKNLCINSSSHSICKKNIIRRRSKMITRRRRSKSTNKMIKASSLAKSIIKKQTQVLKRLMPGGQAMNNECCLIEEALDYIVSLKAQVDVMKELLNAAEYMKKP